MAEHAHGVRSGGGSIRIGSRRVPLPRSRLLRIAIGSLLVVGGVFSFLPVLGVWMLPLGALVLSVDIPRVRRWRRRFALWFARKYPDTAAKLHISASGHANNAKRRGGGAA